MPTKERETEQESIHPLVKWFIYFLVGLVGLSLFAGVLLFPPFIIVAPVFLIPAMLLYKYAKK